MGITAHRVISDLDRFSVHAVNPKYNLDVARKVAGSIRDARKYFLGPEIDMLDNTFVRAAGKDRVFMGSTAEFVRTPYHTIWLEVLSPTSQFLVEDAERYGFLITRIHGHEILSITTLIRTKFDEPDGMVRGAKDTLYWTPPMVTNLVKVGSDWNQSDKDKLKNTVFSIDDTLNLDQHNGNVLDFKYANNLDARDAVMYNMYKRALGMCHIALLMLAAKNVFLAKTHISDTLNRKRVKKGKSVLYSYHTLVTHMERRRSKKSKNKSGVKVALHSVPGTFAFYTREKPLFGHLGPNNIGPIWKSEHMKGSIKEGNVDKDYCIKEV